MDADFAVLLPHTSLIHVQAWDSLEWKKFVAGETTNIEVMLRYATQWSFMGDFVVEYRPGAIGGIAEILFPWILAKSLLRIQERVAEIIAE
ncbi:MAG: hypothetical protein ABIJ36_00895 [Patescibacteria group bacterium]